jgi:hypothetical protein
MSINVTDMMNYLRCIAVEYRYDMPGLWRASQAGRSKSFRQTSGHILRLVSKTYWSSIWRKHNALWLPTRYRSLDNHFQTCLYMKECDTVNRSVLLQLQFSTSNFWWYAWSSHSLSLTRDFINTVASQHQLFHQVSLSIFTDFPKCIPLLCRSIDCRSTYVLALS